MGKRRIVSVLAILAALVALASPHVSRGQEWCDGFGPFGFDGSVFGSIVFEGDLIVCGDFTANGAVSLDGIARWNGLTWQAMGTPNLDFSFEEISTLAVYDGELYLSGRRYLSDALLLRWNGSAWELVDQPLGHGGDGQISSMVEYDGKLVIAGDVEGPVGQPFGGSVAAWDGMGWVLMGDPPDMCCAIGQPADLEVYQGDLYLSGTFDEADGIPMHSLARWDGAQWTPVEGWGNGVFAEGLYATAGGPTAGEGTSLATFQDKLVVGGSFEQAGNLLADNLVAWDGATQTWIGLGDVAGSVWAMHSDGSTLVVGGLFSSVDGVAARNVAQFDGTTWTQTAGGASDLVLHLGQYGTDLVIGGRFLEVGTETVNGLALWDGSVINLANPGQGLSGTVNTAIEFDGELIIGGRFTEAGNIAARRLAAWDGAAWREFGGGANSTVNVLYTDGVDLYAGGTFTEIGGVSVGRVARWTGTTWDPLGPGAPWTVNAIERRGASIFIGGFDFLVRWDGVVSHDIPTNPTGASVLALATYDGKLVVGGSWGGGDFLKTYAAGTWEAMVGGANLLGVDDAVRTFQLWQGLLYVGGSFSSAAGQATRGLARWDGTSLEAWGDQASGLLLGDVYDMTLVGDRLYVTGFGGSDVYSLQDGASAWEPIADSLPGFDIARTTTSYQDDVYVGGSFTKTVSGKQVSRFGRLCMPTAVAPPRPKALRWTVAPNPFNPRTSVRFEVQAEQAEVLLRVLDLRGRVVRRLVSGPTIAGPHEVVWNGKDDQGRQVASGAYLIELSIGGRAETRKIALIK